MTRVLHVRLPSILLAVVVSHFAITQSALGEDPFAAASPNDRKVDDSNELWNLIITGKVGSSLGKAGGVDETTAIFVVQLWQQAEDMAMARMASNAYEAALFTHLERQAREAELARTSPDSLAHIRGFLAKLKQGHTDSLAEPARLKVLSERALRVIGPAAASAFAGVGEMDRIEAFGAKAIPFLLRSAESDTSPNRVASYCVLYDLFPFERVEPVSTTDLLKAVADRRFPFRRQAIRALASRDAESEVIVAELLRRRGSMAPDPDAEDEIALAIGFLKAREDISIPWLEVRLRRMIRRGKGRDMYRWRNYVESLIAFGYTNPNTIDALCRLFDKTLSRDPQESSYYTPNARVLSQFRYETATALGRMGPAARSTIPTLAGALEKSDDASERAAVARALSYIGPDSRDVLERALSNGIEEAKSGLNRLGVEVPVDYRALAKQLLESDDRTISGKQARICREIAAGGMAAREAKPLLLECLRTISGFDPRWAYLDALKALGPEARQEAASIVAKQYRNFPEPRQEELSQRDVAILGEYGADAQAVVPVLIRHINHDYGLIAWDHPAIIAVQSLGKIAEAAPATRDKIVPALIEAKVNRNTAAAAKNALRTIAKAGGENSPAVSEALKPFQGMDVGGFLMSLAGGLASKGPRVDSMTDVDALLNKIQEGDNRSRAIGRLGELGPKAAAAVPVLERALQSRSDTSALSSAVVALAKIEPTNRTLQECLPKLVHAPFVHRQAREARKIIEDSATE